MSRFLSYSPEQAYLIPPDVKQVLGAGHLSFFVHEVVERLDLRRFEQAYGDEGGVLYHPSLMLKVWLYAYVLGLTSSRRLEQRVREDLAFRYLAGGAQPDYWALNAFRRRHARALNDVFVQVLETAQKLGLARVGTVAIDSTRVKANASADRIEWVEQQRQERARKRRKVRAWQKACDADDPNEGAGSAAGRGGREAAASGSANGAGAAAQGEAFAHRCRQSVSARAWRTLRARLHRRDRGERGPLHRGGAGHAERAGRGRPGAHGGRGGTQLAGSGRNGCWPTAGFTPTGTWRS